MSRLKSPVGLKRIEDMGGFFGGEALAAGGAVNRLTSKKSRAANARSVGGFFWKLFSSFAIRVVTVNLEIHAVGSS